MSRPMLRRPRTNLLDRRVTAALITASLWLQPGGAGAKEKARGREIEVWARGAGQHAGRSDGPRKELGVLSLDNPTSPEEVRLADVQLGRTLELEGIWLDGVLERFAKKAGKVDRVLLHFMNGMIIPLRLPGDGESTGVFIARAWRNGETLETTFPEVPRIEGMVPEPQPITFAGNKVVVEDGAHPSQPSSAVATFSPWRYTDSLAGIELADGRAYDRQFEVPNASPELQRGASTFLARCQFCHGVREVGATYGWDFVVPNPIFAYKDADALLTHVKLPQSRDKDGKTMPGQKDAEPAEILELWAWTKALSESKPVPYHP